MAKGLFDSLLKAFGGGRGKKKKRGRATRAAGGSFRPSGEGGLNVAKVLVCDLHGSGGPEFADRITGILAGETAFSTYRLKKAIRQNIRLGLLERLLTAAEEGTKLLKEEKGELLIWGEMEDMGTIARLRFHSINSGGDGQPGTFGLADTLDLPSPLPDGYGEIVRAVVLAAVGAATEGPRSDIAAALKKLLPAVEKAAGELPGELQDEHRAAALNCLGNAFATSIRFGDKKALPGAVKMYEAADALCSADKSPVTWALVQTHWAAALEADGRMRQDPAAVEAACGRYQAVTEGLTRETNGYDWALAHVRKAMGLYKLASMAPERTVPLLKDAAQSFEAALEVYDRNVMPARWGEVMNHYGVVLMALGGHGAGNATYEQSITAFKKALEVRLRDVTPLTWAQTVNNLGAACFALGKRTKEAHLLNEAAICFEGAVGVFRDMRGQQKRTAVIANNLEKVRKMLWAMDNAGGGGAKEKKTAP